MTVANQISYIFSVVVLGLIAYQDYSKRMIHVFLFPLLSFILLFPHVFNSNIHFYLKEILINISFVIIIFLFLFLYISLRNRKFTNFINKQIGLGGSINIRIIMLLGQFVNLCLDIYFLNFILFNPFITCFN